MHAQLGLHAKRNTCLMFYSALNHSLAPLALPCVLPCLAISARPSTTQSNSFKARHVCSRFLHSRPSIHALQQPNSPKRIRLYCLHRHTLHWRQAHTVTRSPEGRRPPQQAVPPQQAPGGTPASLASCCRGPAHAVPLRRRLALAPAPLTPFQEGRRVQCRCLQAAMERQVRKARKSGSRC